MGDDAQAKGEDPMGDNVPRNSVDDSHSGMVVGVSPIDDSFDSVEAGDNSVEAGDNTVEAGDDTASSGRNFACVLFRHQDYDDLYDVDVPAEHQHVIISALLAQVIAHPHPFQIEAIYHLGFNLHPITIMLSKTDSGKTAVPLTFGRLCRGVSLFVVPLIGLGCDLVGRG